jgi:cytochrome c-type biogenesis protein CcmH
MTFLQRYVLNTVVSCLLLLMAGFAAAIDVYEFDDKDDEVRFNTLTEELRCPKCQNQNIADSNAPLAKDLKDKIYHFVEEGKSDDEIIHYLKERYGDFVTYRPPFKPETLLLWMGPFIVLAFAAFFIVLVVKNKPGNKEKLLSDNEQAQLDALLNKNKKDK